ncbi:MAG: ATP-binding cassette domain-containing protein [Bowdeniella nasicola]|nr:ATP-binding cassette domain-containing protein [Bowdeniella nasicola]
MKSSPHALAVNDLTVAYGPATILHDVTTQVDAGEVVAVLGANGSGKSTLMKACLGLAPISAGSVQIFGRSVGGRPRVAFDRIGYVPQRSAAFSETPTTALEVVASGLIGSWRLRPPRGGRERALAALQQMGLGHRAHCPIRVFSGGQMQRTLIARALVRQPDLLILDEPLAGIDQDSQDLLLGALHDLHDAGTAIVVVLHEIGPFDGFLDRALVLAQGTIRHDGAPPTPRGHHAEPGHVHQHPDHAPPAPPTLAPDLSWSVRP